MTEERRVKDKDAFIAAMFRLDPDRLRQLRRIASGMTRCPECDSVNPAAERMCVKCGARLYPVEEAEDARPRKGRKESRRKGDL